MIFLFVPKSVTLNDLEQRNCPYFANLCTMSSQGRTQEGADGAKAPPEIPRKKLFTHSNPEHFMFRSLYKEVSFTIIL